MSRSDPEEYRAYMRDYMLRRYHHRRARLIEEWGGRCVDCGAREDLEFDHARRGSKALDIAKRLASAPMAEIRAELKKCVLRCQTCHVVKTVLERGHTLRAEHLIAHAQQVAQEDAA